MRQLVTSSSRSASGTAAGSRRSRSGSSRGPEALSSARSRGRLLPRARWSAQGTRSTPRTPIVLAPEPKTSEAGRSVQAFGDSTWAATSSRLCSWTCRSRRLLARALTARTTIPHPPTRRWRWWLAGAPRTSRWQDHALRAGRREPRGGCSMRSRPVALRSSSAARALSILAIWGAVVLCPALSMVARRTLARRAAARRRGLNSSARRSTPEGRLPLSRRLCP